MTQHAGQLLTSVPFNNVYDVHHLEVVVESNTVSVWDGDTLKIDSFVLPENDYGYGFGPITCHEGHCCSQLSYFTFNNIKMETMDGASLSDIVNGYDWRTDAERYVFNLSNKAVPELMTEEEIADTAAALLKTDTKFIGIGNENNENQYRRLINAIDGEGIYHSCEDLNSDMNDIEDIIVRAVNAKDYSIKDMITKDITVEYKSLFTDEDGDELLEQEWEYEYDPSIFDKVSDGERKFIRSGNEPVKQFEETGAYTIRLKVRDNPFAKKNDTEEVSTDTDAKEDTVQPDNQDSAGNDDNAECYEVVNK